MNLAAASPKKDSVGNKVPRSRRAGEVSQVEVIENGSSSQRFCQRDCFCVIVYVCLFGALEVQYYFCRVVCKVLELNPRRFCGTARLHFPDYIFQRCVYLWKIRIEVVKRCA